MQLTHAENYRGVGQAIGAGCEFVIDPNRALDPTLSYRVMSHCMRTGEAYANGYTLAQYLNDQATDYVGARRIINGVDRNQEIAGYAHTFEAMTRACLLN